MAAETLSIGSYAVWIGREGVANVEGMRVPARVVDVQAWQVGDRWLSRLVVAPLHGEGTASVLQSAFQAVPA